MLARYAIKLFHMPFSLVPEVFDAVDVVVFIGKQLAVIDTIVPEFTHIERIIRPPTIGINNARPLHNAS